MDYGEALQYLNSLTDYEKIGYATGEPFTLKRVRTLAGALGNPEKSFSSIHIAGTKGKGSTAAFISSILKEAGYTVGLYTSPHLRDVRERIRVNGEMISEGDLARHATKMGTVPIRGQSPFLPTFFEVFTILAFNYFREKKVDYGVIETGLGGRLDATNIVSPEVAVITPISFDHTEVLGTSLDKIAYEKSGIIKKNASLVSAPQQDAPLFVIRQVKSELVLVGKDINFREVSCDAEREVFDIRGMLGDYTNCISHLIGRHQVVNAATAVGAAEVLKKKGARISEENIKTGIEKTANPARCQLIEKNPYVVLDGAQNRASAHALKETLKRNFKYKKLFLVLGISKNKDIKGICDELAPLADCVILTKAKIERAEDPRVIKQFIKNALITNSVKEAMNKARKAAADEDMILVTGSLYVAGELKGHNT